jgi:hypothetical protein
VSKHRDTRHENPQHEQDGRCRFRQPVFDAGERLGYDFAGVYQMGEVYARSCSVIEVPGSGFTPKRLAS